MSGLLPRDLNGKLEYEIAYSLKPEYWGHGYGTEIATTMKQAPILIILLWLFSCSPADISFSGIILQSAGLWRYSYSYLNGFIRAKPQ